MITYQWDDDRNAILKRTRGVSFEQAVMHIEGGDVLDVMAHPNQAQYPNQQVLVVNLNGYAYAVPFVEQGRPRWPRPKRGTAGLNWRVSERGPIRSIRWISL